MAALTALTSPRAALSWLAERGVRRLATDSRQVRPGDAFLAWPGATTDGRQFVAQAWDQGAQACLVEAQGTGVWGLVDQPGLATLQGLQQQAGELASGFLGHPSQQLKVLAITGTNGKTSCAWWLAQALHLLDEPCGVIGTLGMGQPAAGLQPTGLTTPDAVALQAGLRQLLNEGCRFCALEASSIGLTEHRLSGTHIEVALFTNFTQDHLDHHGSMAAYWQAKAALFAWPDLRAAVVNVDDAQGAGLAASLAATKLDLWTYGLTAPGARLRASGVQMAAGGLRFDLEEGDDRVAVRTGLIGQYNVLNVLAVVGGLRSCGVPLVDAARVCAQLTPVPGRMQRFSAGEFEAGPEVVVDYAHTPDALEKALQALQPVAAQRGGQLWCVFGCGGNRDASKRPLMGAVAQREAQHVVLTNDNPRFESPEAVLQQIQAGFTTPVQHLQVIEDRQAAIEAAVLQAGARDVVLIAGKGHETNQEVSGVKHSFSDVAQAQAALRLRATLTPQAKNA
jgi:UDP-N-acetylmuramyl-tripeptide synthetase